MEGERIRSEAAELAALALILAAVAGGVDAIGWLGLGGLFVAHMSGNTVGLTTHVALGEWAEVGRRGFVILAFGVGLAIGAGTSSYAALRCARAGFTVALAIEAVLLVAILVFGVAVAHGAHVVAREPRGPYYALVAMSAAAMGVQSATLRRVGPARARTTFVTGVLTRLVEALVRLTTLGRDGEDAPRRKKEAARARLLGGIWLCYAAGGIASGVLAVHVGFFAVLLPLGLVVVACALDGILARAGVREAAPDEA